MDATIQQQMIRSYTLAYPQRRQVEISGLTPISDGWESEVYAFTLHCLEDGQPVVQDLILRVYWGDSSVDKSRREFEGMRRLHQAAYPVPEVLLLETGPSALGRPFVLMERIDGQPLDRGMGELTAAEQHIRFYKFCRLFVDLHRLDWRPFVPNPDQFRFRDLVARWLYQARAFVEQFRQPEMDPVFDWLQDRAHDVAGQHPSVVHWDFHGRNVLLRADGCAFVIDWTQIEVSDFRFDLAWTLLLASTYGRPDHRATILEEYERLAGAPVYDIEFFEVAAALKRLFSVVVSVAAGADRLGMRPGAGTQMLDKLDHIAEVYALLHGRTGIALPAVEDLLARRNR